MYNGPGDLEWGAWVWVSTLKGVVWNRLGFHTIHP